MQTFFTSDTHYGHGNIITYCCRPFVDRGDMNDTMITAHNAVVGPEDEVWHLGDFAFGSKDYIVSIGRRLNGRIHVILGNHDRKLAAFRELGWGVSHSASIEVDGKRLYLCHKPQFDEVYWGAKSFGKDQAEYHLCGHVHTGWRKRESNRRRDPAKENIINVGVDQWGFVPRTLEELLAR